MGLYDELTHHAAPGDLTARPGTTRHGTEAAATARAAPTEAAGAMTVKNAARIAAGRPSLSNGGESPVVRVRVPQALKNRLHQIAQAQHRKESEIVREALIAYMRVTQ